MIFFDSFNLWTLWALLALDVATTWAILARGGVELNPALRWVISRVGVGPGLLGSHVLIGWVAWWQAAYIGPHTLWVVSVVFGAAVVWNTSRIVVAFSK